MVAQLAPAADAARFVAASQVRYPSSPQPAPLRHGPLDEEMAVEFEVECTFSVIGTGIFVAARLLTSTAFTVPDQPTLGNSPIERWCDIPRSLREDGQPRTDLFIFKLINAEDRGNFESGQRILLE